MGTCKYTTNAAGQKVAQWIGSGTDAGKSWTLTFARGSAGFNSQSAACDAVRRKFCDNYGTVKCSSGRRCYGETCPSPKAVYKAPTPTKVTNSSSSTTPAAASKCTYFGPANWWEAPLTSLSKYAGYQGCLVQGGSPNTAQTGPALPTSSSTGGIPPDNRNCSQGNFSACLSEIGVGGGNFLTDASRTGSNYLPYILIGGGILLAIVLLKR